MTTAQCFIDLYDSTEFRGERRRIYGPVRLEAHLLGLDGDQPHDVSVRVGSEAALRIETIDGTDRTVHAGEQVDTLETAEIRWLEVRAKQA